MPAPTIAQSFDEISDALSRLSAVEWGFVVIAVLTGFTWAWVMGGPKPQRSPAGPMAAAVVAGLICTAALAVFGTPVRI